MKSHLIVIPFYAAFCFSYAQEVWTPDNGDGTYKNPIIYADYSDPDICRVGDDFYLTSSSFHSIPGLPILHSKDLINWQLINHALPPNVDSHFDIPQHGNGVWAPSFRFHDGTFYIYWGDPDRGIFMVKTKDPASQWSAPVLVKKAYGNIDACPLWDDDGRVYLVHAFAHSRAGIKSTLQIVELSREGDEILDKGKIVIDGHADHPTLEGPKFYKRNGYYYLFAPAGGVTNGWQVVFRSRNIYGPYEEKTVLAQGNTAINGPHQGGLVALKNGESWFVHFQDKGAYGRIVHLQPVEWVNDWPLMGTNRNKEGTGEPVLSYSKPGTKPQKMRIPQTSDAFDQNSLGLQWQWNANPKPHWYSLKEKQGSLTLRAITQPKDLTNLWMVPNILTQKIPGPSFQYLTQVDASNLKADEEAGILLFGLDYAGLRIKKPEGELVLEQVQCLNADRGTFSEPQETKVLKGKSSFWLKAIIDQGYATFHYSTDNKTYTSIGSKFELRKGKWVGAKLALFCTRKKVTGIPGSVSFSEVKITSN